MQAKVNEMSILDTYTMRMNIENKNPSDFVSIIFSF